MDGQPKARTKATNKAKRSLRSQTDPEEEKTMDTTDEEEDEEEGTRLKTQSAATTDQDAELLGLMRSFMDEQQRREEVQETLRPARGPDVAPEPGQFLWMLRREVVREKRWYRPA